MIYHDESIFSDQLDTVYFFSEYNIRFIKSIRNTAERVLLGKINETIIQSVCL